jgi:spermidine/putrescine transport system ATP-binding protein
VSGGNAVELRQATKTFGEVTALHAISLEIRDGEFFSLLGPSGCGKTTSLRLIAGFELPTSGEVYIGGQLMGATPAYQRPVNTVFQNYALFPHMTVFQNVAFGLEMKRLDKQAIAGRVAQALDMVQLPSMEHRRPKQLSGGQQQRVALARALVNTPRVLLLDEPLGALDLKLRKAMQLELKSLQERVGITFIYVTHDQEEALTMSDRIAVMNHGVVLQVGTPVEIYERPASRFVADFIGETNLLAGEILSVAREAIEVELPGGDRVKAPVVPGAAPGQPVTMAVRPERVRLEPDPTIELNRVEGEVFEVVFNGATTTILVHLPANQLVIARLQNVGAVRVTPPVRGQRVHLGWSLAATSLYLEKAAAPAEVA